ncbi:MAG: glycosyltransferase [Dysgonamonadaceae bacterium]|jgi:glycosyltransferase involved in cell wall biosynthesis|nr:glycosyltransferase [Dysgonamonadaceae bacterium]
MRITILTPSYNQAQFIEENILSVQDQSYPDIEHIVIDGGSTDNTVDILRKYPLIRWISEKDEGQADALQKGLEMATGDIVGWINSDDYLDADVLQFVADFFETSGADWLIGNISIYDDGNVSGIKSAKITRKALLSDPDILRQQSTFFRKQALFEAGGFDKKYHLTMDLDLWFRLLKISEPVMIDKNMAYFRRHKNQKTSGKHVIAQMKEMLDIFQKNDACCRYKAKLVYRKCKLFLCIRLGTIKSAILFPINFSEKF